MILTGHFCGIWWHLAVRIKLWITYQCLRHAALEVRPIHPHPAPLLLGVCQPHPWEGEIGELLHHTLEKILKRNQCFEYPAVAFSCRPPDSSYHLCWVFQDQQAAVVLPAELRALVPTEILPKLHREEVAALPPPEPTSRAPTASGVCSTGANV